VARGPKKRVFDLPAGQPRLTVEPVGVEGVWVNGMRLGELRGEARLPGRLLREFAA
jgi:N-acyl-D-amino-acid deacylase